MFAWNMIAGQSATINYIDLCNQRQAQHKHFLGFERHKQEAVKIKCHYGSGIDIVHTAVINQTPCYPSRFGMNKFVF